jgi:hypothetical protein
VKIILDSREICIAVAQWAVDHHMRFGGSKKVEVRLFQEGENIFASVTEEEKDPIERKTASEMVAESQR